MGNDFERLIRTHAWAPRVTPRDHVERRALILPGRGYTVAFPLLHWTCTVLHDAGWHVHVIDWDLSELGRDADDQFVPYAAQRLADDAPTADTTLVLAKSLGTVAAPWAAQRGLPGAWLTPVMTDPSIRTALADYPAPSLVIGGDQDHLWQTDAPISGTRLEIGGADHSLEVDGDWRASMDSHRQVAEAVETFAATLT
ncbi:alpha/beta hydrolase [Luteipulveratus mongoliensis]|uniref:Alpha/beta hydrolase n=1 Tax=Luteipulveratus mongoliensis TaxID=571913 RepID=A0A0K1JPH7_9MICO|nr:alpha/beta hydrolase [Luteipulveratus mongoliensis]AKU18470.1 hypothetical protein VV02_25780 [Luteipulveratus mongoliensis]